MSFDTRRTYLCYNNKDLIRDGYIPSSITKGYVPVSSFNVNRLKNPPKGTTFQVTKDSNGVITEVKERRKLLPASKIKVEIDFSKVMKNAVTPVLTPGSVPLPPIGQLIGGILPPIGFGGLTSGVSEMTFHILDAQTKVNQTVVVTKEILEQGGWFCTDGFPLSVFGIVNEHFLEATKQGESATATGEGLNFSDENLKQIGQFSSGSWQGSVRKRIAGATDSNGLFGGRGDPEVKFDKVKYLDQKQLFDKIARDPRKLKFRADNFDATGNQAYPPRLDSETSVDATDRFIRIIDKNRRESNAPENGGVKVDLKVGDKLYITYNVCRDRKVRQNLVHKGVVAQGNRYGMSGWVGAISSVVDAFDYQLCTWKVPDIPKDISYYNVDTYISTHYAQDSQYKLAPKEYYDIVLNNKQTGFGLIEGWRLSESVTDKTKKFWAADYRGILLYEKGVGSQVVFPRDLIIDQDWFNSYLDSLEADKNAPIEHIVEDSDLAGSLFDVSEATNSLQFDKDKIPYHRPFAEALKKVSLYNGQEKKGVGILQLDLLSCFSPRDKSDPGHLSKFDLSFIHFQNANAQPSLNRPCEEPSELYPENYPSENFDASNTNLGVWYSADYINNQFQQWRPAGGDIESYWKVETPYFCGDFGKSSRVYMEKMGGNSLDNYSWIYIDSVAFTPSSISGDKNFYTGESVLSFRDDNVHDCLSYHKLFDSLFALYFGTMEVDPTQNISPTSFVHNDNIIIGPNKLLGTFPSYSSGKPITYDVCKVCQDGFGEDFWWSEDILNGNFGLDFSDEIPTANIPSSWYVKKLKIQYFYKDLYNVDGKYIPPPIQQNNTLVSFYFEGTESSISNVNLFSSDIDSGMACSVTVDLGYYHGGPIQFLGNFWKYIDVFFVEARLTSTDNPNSTKKLDLANYKIDENQSAVVYDSTGKLLVFYPNSESNNIDVALSTDGGNLWAIHKGLIRLIENETASFPVVIKDFDPNYVHLFYVLNDTFIMYKRINTSLFWEGDAFISAKVPKSYKVGDYDTSKKDYEKEYWGAFSDFGTMLRRMPSYFVVGSSADAYFIEQNSIKDDLRIANQKIENQNLIQHPRFEYSGSVSNLGDVAYNGSPFSIHIDNGGIARLFYTSSEGTLYVKRSNDYFSWVYDIKDAMIHKIYKDDKRNEGLSLEIQNVQVIKDDHDAAIISLLYFNNSMLFVRHFDSQLLFPLYDSQGNLDAEYTNKQIELTESSWNKPIFLAGEIPESIRQEKVEEINNKVLQKDSEFLINIPYSKEIINRCDSQMSLDTETQPVGFALESGLMRVFYKDILGNVRGVVLNGMEQPTLEIFLKSSSSSGGM
jgi:hypothetical protein